MPFEMFCYQLVMWSIQKQIPRVFPVRVRITGYFCDFEQVEINSEIKYIAITNMQ